MVGRLFQVTIPSLIFDGADVIRVVNSHMIEDDLYFICRISKNGKFTKEDNILIDDFLKFYKGDILIDPDEVTAAKIMLMGNKV